MNLKAIMIIFSLVYFVDCKTLKHFVIKTAEKDISLAEDDQWWKTGIFYQIYPRSFQDSDGDGTGDIRGIISRLDHLKDMGITGAWLSPVYKSPMVDQGYDISDFRDIDPLFGNLTDLKALVKKAHEIGIKIIMDFVPNHSSDQHDWFKKSVNKDEPYKDYYIWVGDESTEGTVPNNWLNIFGGSAWTWNKERKQYYFHQFTPAQPDLNYRNPKVVQEMKDVMKFWLDLGIDGFRVDAVPFLFEDKELKDEPPSGATQDKSDYGYLKHIYTFNLEETYDLIYEFRSFLDDYNKDKNYPRIMMTEAYADTSEEIVKYYGNGTVNGAHFSFNFNYVVDMSANLTADKIITTTNKWLSHLDKKYTSNWVLGNHDQHRVATRFGVENADALNMLTAFLPGIQITYNGEEIGMENGLVYCNQSTDPQVHGDCSVFEQKSRDFERTPFQWDDSDNAGFSTNSNTWLPVDSSYKTVNLKAQNVSGKKSHYNVYKDMVKFRENFKNISYDALSLIKISDAVLQIIRKTDKGEFIYIFNTGDNAEKFNFYSDETSFIVAVTSSNSQRSTGDDVTNPVTLQPHEAIVMQIKQTL